MILFLCSSGALQANPLDSPGVVYIDGLPCNRACQSYMAWSDQALSARHREERETNVVVVPVEPEIERLKPAARPRVARHAAPVSRLAPRAGIAASNAKPLNTKALNTKTANTRKAAAPNPAYQSARKNVPAATAAATPEKTVEKTVAGSQEPERKLQSSDRSESGQTSAIAAAQPAEAPKSEVKSEIKSEVKPEVKSEVMSEAKSEVTLPPPATLEIAAAPATSESAALPGAAAAAPAVAARTIQQQVVEATGMADLVTAIGTGREAANKSDNAATEPGEVSVAGKTASASPDNPDNLVALVLARPEINSLSDLNNKNIAIEEKQSASSGRVSAALMAAGAAEVQFSEVKAGAIERLIKGEVPAAVLTLASREAAEWFPDIAGFKTFRVPLSTKAKL
ncbi:hypothetical protein [Bradyrhizobium algeriense]|uniref:hypothetical protein n=1 Tax=Bradyrhizobium algeriense TaxID=634784 RepID=UPI001FCE3F8D|nr:hypothetical protein [Bradyrhizobium algeriense]